MLALLMSLFAALFIGTALGILVADFRNYRRAGPLNARPTTIGELSDGQTAKLVGRVRVRVDTGSSSEELRAPVSGRRCAGYRVRVATKKSLFSGWVPKREERRTEGFYLDDGTGEVYVPLDEVHPVLMLATDARFTRGKNKPIRRALRDLLRVGDGAKVRFDEGAIIEGGRVAVFGTFRRRPDPRQSHTREDYREKALCFVAEAEEASALLYVSDERSFLG